jgi:hypothetical protein
MWCAPATIADGIEEFLEVKYLCIGGTDRSLTGSPAHAAPRRVGVPIAPGI